MAIEAARQIPLTGDKDHPVVRLTDVKFPKSILCPASAGEQRDFEVQLISKVEDGSSRMTFEIFRSSPSVNDGWQLCSTGSLEIASKLPEISAHRPGSACQDPLLSIRAHSLQPDIFNFVENLNIGIGEISGDVPRLQPSWQKYPIDPVALACVLSLGPTSVVGQNLPVKHRLSSISVLDIQINSGPSDLLRFSIDTCSTHAGGAMSNIEVSDGAQGTLTGVVRYTATEEIPPTPIASSLFFKPIFLPDITKLTGTKQMSLQDCVQLLTHKWPMSDIIIDKVARDVRKRILRAFSTRKPEKRKRYRSMLVVGDAKKSNTIKSVQYVGEIKSGFQAHMIFIDKIVSIDWLHGYLQPAGLVCVCNAEETSACEVFKHLNYVCGLTDRDQRIGTLWRKKENPSALLPRNRKITFCNRDFELKNSLQITLAPEEIMAFTSLNTYDGRFDAILIDGLERSIIATWPGKDLIPWLQHLMKQANSLLWVTQDASSSPFVDIAGTLLRTLQAEQPSLKVSWLCVNQSERNDVELVKSIEIAYASMMQGENEVRLDMDETGTRIVRYLPDEDIAAATGVVSPRMVDSPLRDRAYELAVAAPGEPVILSYDPATDDRSWNRSVTPQQQRRPTLDDDLDDEHAFDDSMEGYTKIMVEASTINSDDVAAYNGRVEVPEPATFNKVRSPTLALGTFFAGKVLISSETFSRGSLVVGWTEGAHANTVIVPNDRIIRTEDGRLLHDLGLFASLATAMAVLEGHIRARKGDHIHLANMGPVLQGAFAAVCQFLRLEVIQNNDRPSFCIEISDTGEMLVDKTPINIHRYLITCPHLSTELWGDLEQRNGFISSKPQCFPIRCHKTAFEAALKSKDPVVLLHKDLDGISHIPIYRPPTCLCTSEGAYIIIGGLGGLGRYTCSWLVNHGVTSIYAISRSGISSPEAQSLYDSLNSNPNIKLSVIKADACNRTQISSILCSIRAKEPIKGIINMAMILGDAPMASMTGEEWDRALKVKIESSWILHEETKEDKLEAFVLFSSIASVLGNRNQGSYNVGNTFLNALAVFRRREGRTGVAVALGAMTDIGILSTHSTPLTSQTLTRSGLTHLTTTHLSKILEAAFYKSRQQLRGKETVPEEAVMVTGMDMWEDHAGEEGSGEGGGWRKRGGKRGGKGGIGNVYWRNCPEFSHLAHYRPLSSSSPTTKEKPLKDKVKETLARSETDGIGNDKGLLENVITESFLSFLSQTLGFEPKTFDPANSLAIYGLDSLSAVGVQYWVYRELSVNITVAEVFAAASIGELVGIMTERVVALGITKEGKEALKDGG
ncbi:MAG: hypothetical protein Q9221_003589 [Calogaya cf. arnoldii]